MFGLESLAALPSPGFYKFKRAGELLVPAARQLAWELAGPAAWRVAGLVDAAPGCSADTKAEAA